MALHDHCSHCGAAYAPAQPWPRTCAACQQITYRNPLPVAVAVVPVDDGLLLIRRAIPPVGKLALPGGYVDWNESWQAALVREVREETGLVLDESSVREHRVGSVPGHVLIFGLVPPMRARDLPVFTPTSETSELVVATSPPDDVAFPLHAEVVRGFFSR